MEIKSHQPAIQLFPHAIMEINNSHIPHLICGMDDALPPKKCNNLLGNFTLARFPPWRQVLDYPNKAELRLITCHHFIPGPHKCGPRAAMTRCNSDLYTNRRSFSLLALARMVSIASMPS